MKKVLITGASGLLGRAVLKAFEDTGLWDVTGLAYSRVSGNLRKLDITNDKEVKKIFNEIKPDVTIHCAAERKPDIVENKTSEAWKLNVSATERICQEAVNVGCWVLYISTDYIFDGKNPPYKINDSPNPLNKYGQSKLEGEQSTQNLSQEFGILRVPILYGNVLKLDESAVTGLFEKVQDPSQTCVMSDYEKRYPTHCDDVAHVILQLADRRIKDSNIKGIFHWSGDEQMTKYDMAVAMGDVFNLSIDHIQADKTPPVNSIRPYNSQLDCSRLEGLGIGQRSKFKEQIKAVLQPFLTK